MSFARINRLRPLIPWFTLALVTGALVVAGPSPAFADGAVRVVEVPCPSWAGSQPGFYAEPRGVVDTRSNFLTSESRIVVNDLDTTVTATFTSQTSRTFTIAATAGVSFSGLFGFLSANVSSTITSSTTTAIGVSAQAPVPPHSRMIGDYGVDAYQVSFDAYKVQRRPNIGGCWVRADNMGFEVHRATAPTYIQGWRVRLG